MTGFNHTLAGALAAVLLPPPLALPIALGSHFVLDSLPHFGNSVRVRPYTRAFVRWLILDALLCAMALAYSLWLLPGVTWLVIACIGLSVLPDFLWLLRGRVRLLEGYFGFASRIQRFELPWAWSLEFVYAAFFTVWLFYLAY